MICRHNSVPVSKAKSLQQSQDGSVCGSFPSADRQLRRSNALHWSTRPSLGTEPPVGLPFGAGPFGRPSTHGARSGHHRSPVAVSQRERPTRPWLHQRAVKLAHPSALLVGPLYRSWRTLDRFVPIALVLPQRFRAPMRRYDAQLDLRGRTCTGVFRHVYRRSVAALAGSS
jgi:hypothetical protein